MEEVVIEVVDGLRELVGMEAVFREAAAVALVEDSPEVEEVLAVGEAVDRGKKIYRICYLPFGN